MSCAVDVSSVMTAKSRMLKCHASQRAWLRFISGFDQNVKAMKDMSREEGRRAGLKAAEGFIQHLGNGHPQDNILKKLLGAKCVEIARKTAEASAKTPRMRRRASLQ